MDKRNELKILDAVNEVLKGNKEAFRIIIKEYERYLYKTALSFFKSHEETEDAVQEAFIKVYNNLDKFTLGRNFTPWLYTIAMNHFRQLYRRKKVTLPINSTLSCCDHDNPESSTIEKLEIEKIKNVIDSLKDNLKEVVILYYINNLSIEEISEILGIGRENVKSRLHRARKILRKKLEKDAT